MGSSSGQDGRVSIRHTLKPESRAHDKSLAFRAILIAPEEDVPARYANLRWYESSNVQWTLVDKGLMTLETVVEGRAAGVTTTDISRPPDASIGATSIGNERANAGGRGE
jgi:hypothetical protein